MDTVAQQTTDTIVLVRPAAFGLNSQAGDNAFIHFDSKISDPQAQALQEFEDLKNALEQKGINVLVFEDTKDPRTPDSIFPNNVVSTYQDGTIVLSAMKAENRHLEVAKQQNWVQQVLSDKFLAQNIVDYSSTRQENIFLEGTGSIILDRVNKIAYAGLSGRTSLPLLGRWGEERGYEVVPFQTIQKNPDGGDDIAVYHTNFILSVGEDFVAMCFEVVASDAEREKLRHYFKKTNKQIIEVSLDQFYKCAGNMLQVKNTTGKRFVALSKGAFESFDQGQQEKLREVGGEIIAVDIPTIEEVGGGSVRCMMLEIFLPKLSVVNN